MSWFKNPFRNRSGIYKCNACNGKRITKSKDLQCTKCQGTGKLDWVERVVGKKEPDPCQLITFNPNLSWKLMVIKLEVKPPFSFKQFFIYLKGFDIFIQFGKFSIPFLKTIVLLNVLVWIILFFGVK